MSTVFITHPDYLKHKAGPGHPERPERLQAIAAAIDQSPLGDALERIVPDPVDEEQLAAVHRREYIHQVRDLAAHSGGALDPDTVVSPVSFEVALLSAGGAVAATRAVMEGRAHTAFAAVRPPGHHALPDRGMGFCLFNNAAVAAADARQRFGLSRLCVLDWDVHHGNGTQAIFYRDGGVLYISLHQEFWYPGTGAIEETGEGDGTGFTINMPLPAGSGDEGYRLAFEEVVIPVLRASAPQLLIISAGYDAHSGDPLGGMLLSAAGFGTLAQMVLDARQDRSKVAAVLEGGYKLTHLSNSVVATLAAFTGRSVPVVERSSGGPETPYSVLRSRIRQVRSVVRNYWNI